MKLLDVLKDAQVDEGFIKAFAGQATGSIPGLGAAQMGAQALGLKEKAAKAKAKIKKVIGAAAQPVVKRKKQE